MFKMTEKNRKWWILVAMTSCISMIFIDISVLPVALPTIQRLLGMSDLALQWIVNAYTLALSVLVLAGGRLGDRFGNRYIFCWGLLLFSLGSALCGLSYSAWWFITARVIQGIGGALLIPNTMSIIFAAFPANQRGRAMGFYISIGSVFLSIGPFIGGVFSQYLSWRLVFWINLPISLIGLCLTLLAVPKIEGRAVKFDFVGFLISAVGISSIVIAIMQVKYWRWVSFPTLSLLLLGGCLLAFLCLFKRDVEDPYIDFSFFKNRNFVGPVLAIFCTQSLLMVSVFWAIYFQNILGYSPSQAGILSLLSNAPVILSAPLGGHLLDKRGPRLPITIGFCLIAISLFWFLQNLGNAHLGVLLSAIIPFGCGIPLVLTPSFTTALGEVAQRKRGVASGITTTVRQFGGTLGLAVMGSVFLTFQNGKFAQALKTNPLTAPIPAENLDGLLSKTPRSIETLQTLPKGAQLFVKQSAFKAYLSGFQGINVFALVFALVGLFFTLWLIKKRTQPDIEM